jgi:3-oxoadipate enol-lactonase
MTDDRALAVPVAAGAVTLAGIDGHPSPPLTAGERVPVLLLHGLTATRRYVVMGSRTLQRCGHRVVAYDARGHGASTPAPNRRYGYEQLACDAVELLDVLGIDRALLAGASMGAHTAVRVALEQPHRVAALGLITPAHIPGDERSASELERWDALAAGLRTGGVDGFIDAYDLAAVPERWRDTVAMVLRQRMSAHEHPAAVADALEVVPRSAPFGGFDELATIAVPTLVIGSRDEADPGHPLAVAERYAAAIPGAQLLVEDPGPPPRSPIAWQGGQLSKALAALAGRL